MDDPNAPETFNVTIAAPLDHPTPFPELLHQVAALGVTIRRAEPELKFVSGRATQDVFDRLKQVPGLEVSREQTSFPTD